MKNSVGFRKSDLARIGKNAMKGGKSSFHPRNWNDTYVFGFALMSIPIWLSVIAQLT